MSNSSEEILKAYEDASDAIDTVFAEILNKHKQHELVSVFEITKSYMSKIYNGDRTPDHDKKYEFIKKYTKSQLK